MATISKISFAFLSACMIAATIGCSSPGAKASTPKKKAKTPATAAPTSVKKKASEAKEKVADAPDEKAEEPTFDSKTPLTLETLIDGKVSLLVPSEGTVENASESGQGFTYKAHSRLFKNVGIITGVWDFDRGTIHPKTMTKLEAFDMMKAMAFEIAKLFKGKLSEPTEAKVNGADFAITVKIPNGKDIETGSSVDTSVVFALKKDRAGMALFTYKPGSVGAGTVSKVLDSFEMK